MVEGYLTTDDGVRLFYRKAGTGPSVVLVPNGIYLFDDFAPLATNRTIIFYDVRNRGRSDHVDEPAKIARGIHHDVDDVDAVRRQFSAGTVDLIGHSYAGVTVALYAMKYAGGARRVVQIGAMGPDATKQYPPELMNADATSRDVFTKLAELQKERSALDPVEFCARFWSVLRALYVVDRANVERIKWSRCELSNERNFMKYWMGSLLPSIQRLQIAPEEAANAKAPVLVVHGAKDRSAPYGGGRDWAALLPDARLVTVGDGGHAPWIEAPDLVLDAIETFLGGQWPEAAEQVASGNRVIE